MTAQQEHRHARRIGMFAGPLIFALTLVLYPPAQMTPTAWLVAGLVGWVAIWWMTEAIAMSATALLPFIVLPLCGAGTASEVASSYYSPILFLILGGAFLALAIERVGLHRRLAFAMLRLGRSGSSPFFLLLSFMFAAAILSMLISNTSTALIMMPVALAVLEETGLNETGGGTEGLSAALPLGIAFAASIGGLGTIVGSPTNAIAVGLLDSILGLEIDFATWSMFGLPIVLIGVPIAAFIVARIQHLGGVMPQTVDVVEMTGGATRLWSRPERRLAPVIGLAIVLWMTRPLLAPLLPDGALTDGSVAIFVGLALFLLPDSTGRPMLTWSEADRAPWGVILMFGGGLALADGMGSSGLAAWLGEAMLPLAQFPLWLVALAVVAMIVLITEFASNVATAAGILPVIASLAGELNADPLLLAMPAAFAASWGFMMPAGSGPNAIAWSTGHISVGRMIHAGAFLDLAGVVLITGMVWAIAGLR